MGRKLPPRAGAGEEAGAGAALDASPGRSGRPRGLGEAAGAVGLDGRVQGPTVPSWGRRRRAVLPGLWSGRPCGGLAARGWDERARRRSLLFRLAQVGGGRPDWCGRPESVAVGLPRPWSCGRPRHSHARRRGGFTLTHTRRLHARGSGGAATEPRSPHAGSAGRWGTAFPTPPRGPPARRHPSARSRAPSAGPLGALWSSGQLPGGSGDREEGHKAKEAAKRRRRRSRGQGPDSPGGGPGGGDTKGAAKAPGVARGPRVQSLRARLPFPPLPGLLALSQGSSFLHPSGPLRRGAGLSPGD